MALTNIEYGSVASSKVLNDNFNYLEDKIEDYSKNIASDKASLTSLINSQISTTFTQLSTKITESIQALYPVGSVYIGTTTDCPLASLFGNWEKLSSGVITAVDSNVPIKGTGATLGVNNDGSSLVGTLSFGRGSYNEGWINIGGRRTGSAYVTTNANSSGIIGTASSTKLTVNIWKRIA
jgi:hypothetical protein